MVRTYHTHALAVAAAAAAAAACNLQLLRQRSNRIAGVRVRDKFFIESACSALCFTCFWRAAPSSSVLLAFVTITLSEERAACPLALPILRGFSKNLIISIPKNSAYGHKSTL
jgi:hypothetical protein